MISADDIETWRASLEFYAKQWLSVRDDVARSQVFMSNFRYARLCEESHVNEEMWWKLKEINEREFTPAHRSPVTKNLLLGHKKHSQQFPN